ncbi:MAG: hypothetical protein H0V49_07555, partial [Nocardioidaceae bacterium]|nr:hypothetical protein [Nocardioidaceae bacterium]
STPAVVNAIVDALRPRGINDIAMPCTPHRVWSAIQSSSSGEDTPARSQNVTDSGLPSHNVTVDAGPAHDDKGGVS